MNFIFNPKTIKTNNKDIPFASIMGKSFFNIPYINHKNMPNAKKVHIQKEISFVSFNLIVLITCGKEEIVVRKAAAKPIIFMGSMNRLI